MLHLVSHSIRSLAVCLTALRTWNKTDAQCPWRLGLARSAPPIPHETCPLSKKVSTTCCNLPSLPDDWNWLQLYLWMSFSGDFSVCNRLWGPFSRSRSCSSLKHPQRSPKAYSDPAPFCSSLFRKQTVCARECVECAWLMAAAGGSRGDGLCSGRGGGGGGSGGGGGDSRAAVAGSLTPGQQVVAAEELETTIESYVLLRAAPQAGSAQDRGLVGRKCGTINTVGNLCTAVTIVRATHAHHGSRCSGKLAQREFCFVLYNV